MLEDHYQSRHSRVVLLGIQGVAPMGPLIREDDRRGCVDALSNSFLRVLLFLRGK